MCYLYDTIHELFEAKELNFVLFKEFCNKYKENESLITFIKAAVFKRCWVTKEVAEIFDYKVNFDDNDILLIENIDIIDFIKIDDVDNFINMLTDQTGKLKYKLCKIFTMIFYYNAVKCLKYMLLQKDKDYFGKYLNKCNIDYCCREYIDLIKYRKYKSISSNIEIIKTIRSVIGFNKRFESMVFIDALDGLNFNVIRNVEYECKMNKCNMCNNYLHNISILYYANNVLGVLFYKSEFTKREIYDLNTVDNVYKIAKEYIDYLCETHFDKDYDKELMGIVVASMNDTFKENARININDFNIDFFKPYNELYLAAFSNRIIDLKNNPIYNMLSQNNRNLIDIFVYANNIKIKGDAIIKGTLKSIYNKLYCLSRSINIDYEKSKSLVDYIALFNSAFNEII